MSETKAEKMKSMIDGSTYMSKCGRIRYWFNGLIFISNKDELSEVIAVYEWEEMSLLTFVPKENHCNTFKTITFGKRKNNLPLQCYQVGVMGCKSIGEVLAKGEFGIDVYVYNVNFHDGETIVIKDAMMVSE